MVLNKIDCANSETLAISREEFPQAVFIAARDRLGLETLRQKISQLIRYAVASWFAITWEITLSPLKKGEKY